MQIKPNESKQKSLHFLAFPWISLAELGLFNALRRIQIKKSYFLATRVLGCAKRPRTLLLSVTAFGGLRFESG
jgi:hypothetical protein